MAGQRWYMSSCQASIYFGITQLWYWNLYGVPLYLCKPNATLSKLMLYSPNVYIKMNRSEDFMAKYKILLRNTLVVFDMNTPLSWVFAK